MKNLFLTAITFFGLASITIAQVPSYVPTTGLVGWWGFNGNANDQSVNSLNGTVNGATLSNDRFGNTNSSYSFNGTSNFISIPDNNALDLSSQYSISVWFKIPDYSNGPSLPDGSGSTDNERTIIGKPRTSGWATGYNIKSPMNGVITKVKTDAANMSCCPNTGVLSLSTPSLNAWVNVIVTYNGSVLKLYFNGILENSITAVISLNNSTESLYIGKEFNNVTLNWYRWFKGNIDDIGIWNRALTPCEVTQLYNASVIATPTITVIGSTALCSGKTATLTTSTVGSYTWSNGANTQSITVNNAGSYSVSVTTSSCIGNASPVVISVNPTPTITVNSGLICLGESFTILPSGASTYTYSSGSAVVSPTASSSYSVTGTCSLGCVSSNTAVSSVTVNACTGIDELLTNAISIFPNPNHGLFTIELNKTTQVMITDVFGQVILTETVKVGKQTLDIKNHANGIYFVRLIKDGKQQTIKLIKE